MRGTLGNAGENIFGGWALFSITRVFIQVSGKDSEEVVFMSEREGRPHPRKEPEFPGALTAKGLEAALGENADLETRTVWLAGQEEKAVKLWSISGLVKTERVNDYVLRPLSQDEQLAARGMEDCFRLLEQGGIYTQGVKRLDSTEQAVRALLGGEVVLLFETLGLGLGCSVETEEKRSISDAEEEPDAKGAKDGFVESVRTNTSLIRRRLRSGKLRVWEEIVGRQSRTAVDVVYLEGIAREETVAKVKKRLKEMDVDGVLTPGQLEPYLCDEVVSPFPQLLSTRRPDRVCGELLNGRIVVLADGIPVGFVVPGTLELFLSSPQDRSDHWTMGVARKGLRYLALLVTVFLPGIYVAAVLFHPEMIPLALAESIIAAREDVPFGTVSEAVMLLLAFEILQEAGLRLPGNLGQTVGILGGLVVGSAAVEAKILSPAVLIVIAAAGVAGYTIPSQDLAGAARIWRFGLTLAAGVAGLLGVALGAAGMVGHLAGLSSFGVPYLARFTQEGEERPGVFGLPLPWVKLRPEFLVGWNRRRQR